MGWTILFLCVQLIHGALTLNCLQCNGISQPRHCKSIEECKSGEVCGVEKIINNFGDTVYNVGCITELICQNRSSNHRRSYYEVCRECCNVDLCNAQGCGEPGYPQNRGPVCYSCSLQTDPGACHAIDFCDSGEVCKHVVFSEFGDNVYTSECSSLLECKDNYQQGNLFGRDVTSVQEQSDLDLRSLTGQVCHNCCDTDLCNKDCNGTHAPAQCVDTTPSATCKLASSVICRDKTHAQNGGCLHYCGFC
ncbi:uncharacterized protein LOC123543187 [Mercenaria mercenaria]|uniref:uncharacterized protein LOC123543187 n=1 Tax=Mercenaria mercenaria TaxID=6596 RepID=UPI00234ECDAE|nr:uncharacterized protein LOC123543187 [Mercenaria mercenaria]XP_045185213.2 uncharacterized protein LOC123543187 [Mercenaria mercenaria]XP_045185214.2 uncharacterized protein LOC123543187 [Mercenaria mercenaria]